MHLNKLHHVAIICSDYEKAKEFYVTKLGLPLVREVYRPERRDYILTLLVGNVEVELFVMENPPQRVSNPEARGLRHLAFHVVEKLSSNRTSKCIRWEITKHTACPVGILQTALCVIGNIYSQICLVQPVPFSRNILHLQRSCNQLLFNLIADHNVKGICQFICFRTDK